MSEDQRRLHIVPPPDERPIGDDDLPEGHYRLRLYVAGQSPKSLVAIANLNKLCEAHLPGCHSVEVVDLAQHPELAAADQVLAVPTLVRRLPPPIKRIIGTLADVEKVLVGLELRPDARRDDR